MKARLGLSLPAMGALALLAVPRAVLHDLGEIEQGSLVNFLLAVSPPVVWVVVVLARRVADPLRTLLAVGAIFGVMLAITHQLLWSQAWGDDPPALGDQLEGVLPEAVEAIAMRVFAVGSSIMTGILMGVLSGVVAAILNRGAFRVRNESPGNAATAVRRRHAPGCGRRTRSPAR